MIRYLWMILFAAMVFAWTPDAEAQGRSDRGERGRTERGERVERSDRGGARGPTTSRDRRDDGDVRRDRRSDGGILQDVLGGGRSSKGSKQGKGPAFCRSGEGHPVHGRQWCREKGFGLGGYGVSPRWERQGWEDVILPAPRRRDDILNRGTLGDILGDVILGRFDRHRQYLGADESLVGRWSGDQQGRSRVLELSAGSVPIARLLDHNGDGRADEVLLNVAR